MVKERVGMEGYITGGEAAKMLGISVSMVWKLARAGHLEVHRLSPKDILVLLSSVISHIENHRATSEDMTSPEASALLGLTVHQIGVLVKNGRIKLSTRTYGRRLLLDRASVMELAQERSRTDLTSDEIAWALKSCDEGAEIKPVEGFPLYWVSSCGKMFSKRRDFKLVEMKLSFWKGYKRVRLFNQKFPKGKTFALHRVIAKTFLPPPPPGKSLVLHREDIRHKNSVLAGDLRFGDYGDNAMDKVVNGRMPHGEQHFYAKLREEDVHEIYRLVKMGTTDIDIANKYGVSHNTVRQVRIGGAWKHLYDAEAMAPFKSKRAPKPPTSHP